MGCAVAAEEDALVAKLAGTRTRLDSPLVSFNVGMGDNFTAKLGKERTLATTDPEVRCKMCATDPIPDPYTTELAEGLIDPDIL